ncbi:thiamine phosphate synthase [Pleomorphovibrio marinus]|uniref:thiamine phosphate synthase n=1 Tax=Pleomorphovibrio marinus TaxID=2164132 RepID=UPI0018E5115F|nr:thiamine phosphate synthase [Pleomorphovibrio marinus]
MERLQFISQGDSLSKQKSAIRTALFAGCKWVQLRFKGASEMEFLTLAKEVKPICAEFGSLLIINDNVKVAEEIDADGVHLGLQDMPIEQARAIIGKEKIIGGTANTLSDLQQRTAEGCDYIGLGPLRFTPTKKNLSPLLGMEGYKRLLSNIKGTPPIIAIGGIRVSDIEALMAAGIFGVAISSTIVHHSQPKTLIQQIHEKFQRHIENCR